MEAVIKWLVDAVFGTIVQGIVDGVNAYRRDAALRDLGYAQSQIDAAKANNSAARAAQMIDARPPAENVHDTIKRL